MNGNKLRSYAANGLFSEKNKNEDAANGKAEWSEAVFGRSLGPQLAQRRMATRHDANMHECT